MRLWDLNKGSVLGSYYSAGSLRHLRFLRSVQNIYIAIQITFSQGGNCAILGSEDDIIKICDFERKRILNEWVIEDFKSFSPDGRLAFAISESRIALYALAPNEKLRKFSFVFEGIEGPQDHVNVAAVTSNGELALSGSSDKSVQLWNLEGPTPQKIRRLDGHQDAVLSVALNENGSLGLSGSMDGTIILWDLEKRHIINKLYGHSDKIFALAIDSHGDIAISASADKTLRVWSLKNYENSVRPIDVIRVRAESISITPDLSRAILGSRNFVSVLDLNSGKELKCLEGHRDHVCAVAITPNGTRAVSASRDFSIGLWDLETGKGINLNGHRDCVNTVAITQDGSRAISGSADKTIRLWDLNKCRILKKLKGHWGGVHALDISVDGRYAISGSSDATIVLWDLNNGTILKRLKVR